MNKHDDGEPAFPNVVSGHVVDGLTKREWYAGQAMSELSYSFAHDGRQEAIDMIAMFAFRVADAMITEGKKE